jgi:VWFA-related protein
VCRTFPSLARLTGLSLILCGSFDCALFAETKAASPDLTFRSDVTEVRMTFSTTDQNNRIVATIQPSDLAIVDQDRVIRDFRSFTRSDYTRLKIAVLLDASESVSPRFRQELLNVMQLIAQSNGVPAESLSVIAFRDMKPAILCDGNCLGLKSESQLSAAASGGQTPLYDSIAFASTMLGRKSDEHTRRILVLLSDGIDTISLKSFGEAIKTAIDNDVAINTIDASKRPHSAPGTLVLRSLALNTGGEYFPIEVGTEKELDAILTDFHATYTVAYKLPTHEVGFHLVRILPTHNSSLQFHCRRGYYYPSNSEN